MLRRGGRGGGRDGATAEARCDSGGATGREARTGTGGGAAERPGARELGGAAAERCVGGAATRRSV
jgi:hypothetical protein